MFLLNFVFHLLHIIIILSSLFLYWFDDFVGLHLILQVIILSSWLIIGPIMKKPGVCVLTELQKKMGLGGDAGFSESYIVYLVKKLGYKGHDNKKIDLITFSVFALSSIVSIYRYVS
ncbi:MAG: DUF2784 family protein [Gammaproteobacteria bacterium]|nr:DUF2784 family protein [Gammaproteobacteria bacterium]